MVWEGDGAQSPSLDLIEGVRPTNFVVHCQELDGGDTQASTVGRPVPSPKSKSRANALISATADLDHRDLEEVTVYAQFRRAQRSRRRA